MVLQSLSVFLFMIFLEVERNSVFTLVFEKGTEPFCCLFCLLLDIWVGLGLCFGGFFEQKRTSVQMHVMILLASMEETTSWLCMRWTGFVL